MKGSFLSDVELKFLEEKLGWATPNSPPLGIAPLCPRTTPQTWEAIALPFSSKNGSDRPLAPLQLLHLNPRHFQHHRSNRHKPPDSRVIATPHWRCSRALPKPPHGNQKPLPRFWHR